MNYDELEKRLYSRTNSLPARSEYVYIDGSVKLPDGRVKNFVLGPYLDEQDELYRQTVNMLNGKSNITYRTFTDQSRDRNRVTQKLKAQKLRTGLDIEQVLGRFSHKV